MNEIEIMFKSVGDFFSSSMLKIALIPVVITMFILYILFFSGFGFGIGGFNGG